MTECGKSSQIKHFQDKTNKTALPIIDLIDAMKTGVIDYAVVKTGSKLDGEVNFAGEEVLLLEGGRFQKKNLSGLPFQCKVCCQHGAKDWSASVCPT